MKILCIDIGGSFLKHTLIQDGQILRETDRTPTPRDTLDHFLDVIRDIYLLYREEEPKGIAISTPGVIDPDSGYMYTGGSLDYIHEINMRDLISQICDGLPVSLENDAKAAATAELYSGVLKDVRNGVVLTIGTAIGGTVIIDRKILRGKNLFAGEASYAIYQDDGTRGSDWDLTKNNWGCHGVPAQIVRDYGDETLQTEEIIARMQKGDEKAQKAVRQAARDLALLSHNLQCFFDPEIIAIGGGISIQKSFVRMLVEESEKITQIYGGVVPQPDIRPCRFYNNANLIGAFYAFTGTYEGTGKEDSKTV